MLKDKQAIIFDLDNTLLVEVAATSDAFKFTCEGIKKLDTVDVKQFHQIVWKHAKNIWSNYYLFDYCDNIQVSFCEALCADFIGEDSRIAILNNWAPEYRKKVWYNALLEIGIDDIELAEKLGEKYKYERKQRFYTFQDVPDTLNILKANYKLAILTNGVPDLQWEKIKKSGIEHYFDNIVISGEVGVGKPNAEIFLEVLKQLNLTYEQVVMVGDNMRRDILGANKLGIFSIWVNHEGSTSIGGIKPSYEIKNLKELLNIVKKQ